MVDFTVLISNFSNLAFKINNFYGGSYLINVILRIVEVGRKGTYLPT